MHTPKGHLMERGFDYGRSLLYTIYRHASGMTDAEAAAKSHEAAARRREMPALAGGGADSLAARLDRLRGEKTLSLPA